MKSLKLLYQSIFSICVFASTHAQVNDLSVFDYNDTIKLRGISKKKQRPVNQYENIFVYSFVNALYKGKQVFDINTALYVYQKKDSDFSNLDVSNEDILIPRFVSIYAVDDSDENQKKTRNYTKIEESIISNLVSLFESNFNASADGFILEGINYIYAITRSTFSNPKLHFDISKSTPEFFPYENKLNSSLFINLEKYYKTLSEALSVTNSDKLELTPYLYVIEKDGFYNIHLYLHFAKDNSHLYSENVHFYFNERKKQNLVEVFKELTPMINFSINETKKRVGYEYHKK